MKLFTNRNAYSMAYYISICILFCACTSVSTSAYASGAAHHADATLPSLWQFILQQKIYWLNFIVFTTLLVIVLRKVFIKAWVARRATYMDAISSGKKLLDDSQSQLSTARQLLAALPAEVSSMQARMLKEVEFDAERIIQEASGKAEKIKNQASQSAAVERRAAIKVYQEQLVELAIARARTKVSGMLTTEVDSRLKERVLGSVSGLLN